MSKILELHCAICSRNGTHRGVHSLVALFDADSLTLPLDGSMFSSPMPHRGIGDPWQPGTTWEFMKCPRGNHLVWPIKSERELIDHQKGETPQKIVTNIGTIIIGNSKDRAKKVKCQVPGCGKEFDNDMQLRGHMMGAHYAKAKRKKQ